MSPAPPLPDLPEISLAGFLQSGLGLGETGRLIVHSLESVGITVHTHAWGKSDIASVPFATSTAPAPAPAPTDSRPPISLFSLNGEHLASFMGSDGKNLFADRYVISIWFWELPELTKESRAGFHFVDEVWAATPFIHDALIKHSGDLPVRTFNHPVRTPSGNAAAARARFPFDNRFVFLFTFDYQSCAKRKNPAALCEAFAQAFPHPLPGGPLCVVKSINASLHPVADTLLRRKWAHRPDIVFYDEFLSPADRDLLTWRADACVSLHRSEGLGLTLMEAMAIGKPCIATAYSGNLAFMRPEHTWLIPYSLVKVGPGSLHYPAEQVWADPDIPAAAAALREVFTQSPEVLARAAAGAHHIQQHHSPEVCGHQLAALLAQAATRQPRPHKTTRTARADAYDGLARLRESAKQPDPPTSWLRLPSALKNLARISQRRARAERQVMSDILAAMQQQEERHRVRQESLQRRLDRLSQELSQTLALLPALPPAPLDPKPHLP